MNRISKLLALAIAALSLVAAGCGGGDDTTTIETGVSGATGASGAPLSKEQFVAQADAICKDASQQIKSQAGQTLSQSSSPNEIAAFTTNVLIPKQEEISDQIRALTPPEGDEDQVSAILDAVDSALQRVKDDPDLQADPQAAEAEFTDADQLATDYGLEECGN